VSPSIKTKRNYTSLILEAINFQYGCAHENKILPHFREKNPYICLIRERLTLEILGTGLGNKIELNDVCKIHV
jgi:hypothetical protein